ncbi:CopG family ribbon-helix-helix protein [Pseudomonas sp. PDM22]|uniref:CopG family ribbon-helix-helix protein n=1 Tax=Pseudomonas sp. PDM22 TaxID=2769287 RepID=UPI0017866C71|nr:ribbon-helix-helix protein, CopG family [Pseudomonas sp. PDM22]MBD9513664.1 ribbon-helix-helix protein, CopG family [Pseudomonas sp. PDM22]
MSPIVKTTAVSVLLPLQLARAVEQLVERTGQSRDQIVHQALEAWVEREQTRSRLTRESLSDVDSGHVVDHQAVLAWAESLSSEDPLPAPFRQP